MLKEVVFLRKEEKENWKERLSRIEKESSLIVTDDPVALKKLKEQNFYVAGLHHDENREQYFEGASYVVEDVSRLERKAYEEIYCRLAGLPLMVLSTEHLLIRESTVEDVDSFYEIYRDPSITRYMEDLFADPDEEKAYMRDYIQKIYGFYGYGMWSVLLKDSGKVIGRAGLSVREGFDLPELGFVIGKGEQRKGYAYEACRGILQYAKDELEAEAVQALVEPENIPSKKLLEKLGFSYQKIVKIRGISYEYLLYKN